MSLKTIKTRLSMNTSLKNARIFDDDSWDEVTAGLVPDKKIKEEPGYTNTFTVTENVAIKTEIKQEVTDEITVKSQTKPELFDESANLFPINSDTFTNTEIKMETLDDLASPFKKVEIDNSDSNSRQSFKSTKISLYKRRESPYKKPVFERLGPSGSKPIVKAPNFDEEPKTKKKRKSIEFETDPAILSRRQKQIDYGKNTLCYDNYIATVPRNERKIGDPQTPKKHIKYSRRAWDGLIKQWRVKLHKYDLPNEEES